MSEEEFQDFLKQCLDILEEYYNEQIEDIYITNVHTFESCGILSNNKGLVISMSNGSEFQVTIVKSR